MGCDCPKLWRGAISRLDAKEKYRANASPRGNMLTAPSASSNVTDEDKAALGDAIDILRRVADHANRVAQRKAIIAIANNVQFAGNLLRRVALPSHLSPPP